MLSWTLFEHICILTIQIQYLFNGKKTRVLRLPSSLITGAHVITVLWPALCQTQWWLTGAFSPRSATLSPAGARLRHLWLGLMPCLTIKHLPVLCQNTSLQILQKQLLCHLHCHCVASPFFFFSPLSSFPPTWALCSWRCRPRVWLVTVTLFIFQRLHFPSFCFIFLAGDIIA